MDVGWAIDVLHPLAQQVPLTSIDATTKHPEPVEYGR